MLIHQQNKCHQVDGWKKHLRSGPQSSHQTHHLSSRWWEGGLFVPFFVQRVLWRVKKRPCSCGKNETRRKSWRCSEAIWLFHVRTEIEVDTITIDIEKLAMYMYIIYTTTKVEVESWYQKKKVTSFAFLPNRVGFCHHWITSPQSTGIRWKRPMEKRWHRTSPRPRPEWHPSCSNQADETKRREEPKSKGKSPPHSNSLTGGGAKITTKCHKMSGDSVNSLPHI